MNRRSKHPYFVRRGAKADWLNEAAARAVHNAAREAGVSKRAAREIVASLLMQIGRGMGTSTVVHVAPLGWFYVLRPSGTTKFRTTPLCAELTGTVRPKYHRRPWAKSDGGKGTA